MLGARSWDGARCGSSTVIGGCDASMRVRLSNFSFPSCDLYILCAIYSPKLSFLSKIWPRSTQRHELALGRGFWICVGTTLGWVPIYRISPVSTPPTLWFTRRRTMEASASGVLQLRYMALPLSLISTSVSFNKVHASSLPPSDFFSLLLWFQPWRTTHSVEPWRDSSCTTHRWVSSKQEAMPILFSNLAPQIGLICIASQMCLGLQLLCWVSCYYPSRVP